MADRQPGLPKFLTSFNPWLIPTLTILLIILAPVVVTNARPTLDWAPGIPEPEQSSRLGFVEAFWPQFYSSILAGIISGLVAGAIAGFIVGRHLLNAEMAIDERRTIERMQEEVDGFKFNVWFHASQTAASKAIPEVAADIMPKGGSLVFEECRSKPLSIWLERLDGEREFLVHVLRMLNAYQGCNSFAGLVDESLRAAANEYRLDRPLAPGTGFETEVALYTLARVSGVPPGVAARRFATLLRPEELESAHTELMEYEPTRVTIPYYLESLEELKFHLEAVRNSATPV